VCVLCCAALRYPPYTDRHYKLISKMLMLNPAMIYAVLVVVLLIIGGIIALCITRP
jgi:hypothetical protein